MSLPSTLAPPRILDKHQRMELALKAKRENPERLNADCAREYGVSYSTFCHRFNGRPSIQDKATDQQRLTVIEEQGIIRWLTQLLDWGWPASVAQLQEMASHLFRYRNDYKPLHDQWYSDFLERYPDFKLKWSKAYDQARKDASDIDTFQHWFELYKATVDKYGIAEPDRYNMDEKGFAMGIIGSKKIIVRRRDYDTYRIQPGNREWVSLIEAVSMDGFKFPAYVIFAGQKIQTVWGKAFNDKNAHIRVSDKGWITNEISVHWLIHVFHKHSLPRTTAGGYRLLILDGHGSHVTFEFIEFCWKEKIVPLCLPPHATHYLQPLDVGIFRPLAETYKRLLYDYCKYGAVQISKEDFLRMVETAREQAMTPTTI
jgi:hypothetical protein